MFKILLFTRSYNIHKLLTCQILRISCDVYVLTYADKLYRLPLKNKVRTISHRCDMRSCVWLVWVCCRLRSMRSWTACGCATGCRSKVRPWRISSVTSATLWWMLTCTSCRSVPHRYLLTPTCRLWLTSERQTNVVPVVCIPPLCGPLFLHFREGTSFYSTTTRCHLVIQYVTSYNIMFVHYCEVSSCSTSCLFTLRWRIIL